MAVYQLPPLDFRVVSTPFQLCQWDSLWSPKHVKPSWVVPSHISPTNAHAFKLHAMMIYVSHILHNGYIPSCSLYVIFLFRMPFRERGTKPTYCEVYDVQQKSAPPLAKMWQKASKVDLFSFVVSWICPPTQDASVTTRLIITLAGILMTESLDLPRKSWMEFFSSKG